MGHVTSISEEEKDRYTVKFDGFSNERKERHADKDIYDCTQLNKNVLIIFDLFG